MKQYLWIGLLILGLSGCALPVRTRGVAAPVTWTTSAFALNSGGRFDHDRSRFSFTLTLQEAQGVGLTLTDITWEVEQSGVDLSGRQTRTGSWPLPANGQLRQPFVYRIFCSSAGNCPDVGPTTQWHITLAGHDDQGRAVRLLIEAELPWIPPRTDNAAPQAKSGDELPPIDFTVPRLYFPRFGND